MLIAVVLLRVGVTADAQQPAKIPRIGYISGTGTTSNQGPYVAALRQGLRDLGYVEGKNFVIDYRGAEGNLDHIPKLVNDLVERKVYVCIGRDESRP
jgi:putative ABC transport system substrate-binding protein